MSHIRIGYGYDVHRLTAGRRLVLGGVEIPFTLGLLGHSDADVLVHAVIDAIFGALAEKDIGSHFPDSDDRYLGADSLLLLDETAKIMREKGYAVGNIDCTIVAQAPKLAPHADAMRKNIADVLQTGIENVSVKAKTEEKLGFTGRMEGIAAHAICLLEKVPQ